MNRRSLAVIMAATLVLLAGATPAIGRPARTAPGPEPEADSTLAVPGQVDALAADTFPGDPVQWLNAWTNPITGTVDAAGSRWDYYAIYLEAGEEVLFELAGPLSGADFALHLFDPTGSPAPGLPPDGPGAEESIAGDINVTGTWSVAVEAVSGSGPYELQAWFVSPDDDVPAVAIGRTPIVTTLDSYSDWDDVYRVWLNAGDILTLSLSRGSTYSSDFYPNLYLYPPGTTSVWDANAPIEGREGLTYPKSIVYTATASGYYYVDLYEANPVEGPDTHDFGEARLTWKVTSPVYRFYNFVNNTHFFTPSASERDTVIARWSNTYRFEGVAYRTNVMNNTTPLTRLYNKVSGSHFYTASWNEAASALAKWPAVFQLDGPTYAVNPARVPDSIPIYRFYNRRNGSHFYTASESEKNTVIATWPHIYTFEGPVFWIGQ